MNENQTSTSVNVRPTKKQKELLAFIEQFIGEHGYSPSYREIMTALNYNSVATVALHVGNLIKRGHLAKRDHSARSLEVVHPSEPVQLQLATNQIKPADEKWLIAQVEFRLNQAELSGEVTQGVLEDLYILVGALRVLGLDGAAQSFVARLTALKNKAVGQKAGSV